MVVPLVIVHRQQQVIARIRQQPDIVCFRPALDIAHGREQHAGISNDTATRFEQDGHPFEQVLGFRIARGFAGDAQGFSQDRRRFEISAQHVAFVLGQIVSLGPVAQVVHRNPAA